MESKSCMRAGMFFCCAATVILTLISAAGYSYAARFSRNGVASGGSFAPGNAGRTGAGRAYPADRVEARDGHVGDRVGGGDGRWDDRPGDGRPGRECPPGPAGRDCRRYYRYDYDDYVHGSETYYPETVETLPCSATVITVDTITYYRCDTTYYTQIFSDGSVLYVACETPRGY